MVFHGQGASKKRKGEEVEGGWRLGGKRIGIVQTYVYLGVEIDSKGTFRGWKIGREIKARKAWWGAWKMGIEGQYEEWGDDMEGDGAVSVGLRNRGLWWFGKVGGGRDRGEEDGESDFGSEEEYGE